MKGNVLYQGDNLRWLRQRFREKSVDLVYLDPPFKSNKRYRAKEKASARPAFADTWRWDEAARGAYEEAMATGEGMARAMLAFYQLLGPNDMMAYLAMMAPRLIELRRVLKPTGAVYLHCDPTASHYLKVLMDAVFGPGSFTNEIIWHYRRWTNSQRQFQSMHDTILFYRKARGGVFNPPEVEPAPSQARVIERGWNVNKVEGKKGKVLQLLIYDRQKARRAIKEGRLDPGRYDRVVYRRTDKSAASDTWTDIQYLHSQARERIGYPTQKPEELLLRIISTSSREQDLVLDPFCGSGTTLVAAQRLNRRWAGIEISPLAVELAGRRLAEAFGRKARWRLVDK